MTLEEHCDNIVRHFPTILARWKGGSARMWELTTSHSTLTLIITKPSQEGTLGVHCIDPLYVRGPCRWEDSELAVSYNGQGEFVVRDLRADVEVRSGMVEIAEYKTMYSVERLRGGRPQNTA
jgi:hypothetical protein